LGDRIVVLGRINLDIVLRSPHLPEAGENIVAKGISFQPGGKGANQALAAARLGKAVTLIGTVGSDPFVDLALQNLREAGVDLSQIKRVEARNTGLATIIVTDDGQNRIIVEPGANMLLEERDVTALGSLLRTAAFLLLQLEVPWRANEAAARIAKESGTQVILDPGPISTWDDHRLRYVDILTPNESEFAFMTQRDPALPVSQLVALAREFVSGHGLEAIVLKRGSDGAIWVDRENTYHQRAFSVPVVDTTGAGDCFNGALAVALSNGEDPPSALRFACAVASVTVGAMGAQNGLVSPQQVRSLLVEGMDRA
jgi:ribokinase